VSVVKATFRDRSDRLDASKDVTSGNSQKKRKNNALSSTKSVWIDLRTFRNPITNS